MAVKKKKPTKKSLASKLTSKLTEAVKPKKKATKTSKGSKTYAEIGEEGEQRVYEYLVSLFGVNSVFRNIYVQRNSGSLTEIDLLVVHTTGVYVVESKNYAGLVIGDGTQKDWTQVKSPKFKRTFYSPVAQNKGHIDALREACQRHLGFVPPMLSLLVFPDHCDLQVVKLPAGLRCCRLSQLPSVLSAVVKQVSPALTQAHIQALVPLFYNSQKTRLPASVIKQHEKDVASAKRWAGGK